MRIFRCIKCTYTTSYRAGMITHARLCGQRPVFTEIPIPQEVTP